MEDLREAGLKAIASVNKLKASDAGDLVLGISEIIQELREEPELRLKYPIKYQNKLDHLEGLFREFAYGEGYELRNNRVEILEKEEDDFFSGFGAASGFLTTRPLVLSGTMPPMPPPRSSVAGIPPVMPSLVTPPSQDDMLLGEEEKVEDDPFAEALRQNEENLENETKRKPFKPKWWQKQVDG